MYDEEILKEKNRSLQEVLEIQKGMCQVYERVKNRNDLGIGAELLTVDILEKTGKKIIGDKQVIGDLKEWRWAAVPRLLNNKLSAYTAEEWYACLYFKLFLDYTIPMMSRILSQNPLLPGTFWRGELIYMVLKLEDDFWQQHEEWKRYFQELLHGVLGKYSEVEIVEAIGEKPYGLLKEVME
ncbi:MAG: hypothetical protein IJ379_04860 [Lachnospiraceae bacterium]|nr:hypothetical protein [Lachnospiraceae bacterium]